MAASQDLARREPPIVAMLRQDGMQQQLAMALPKHLTKERFLRMMLTCIRQVPKLATCDQSSVLGAMFELAQMGLEPNTPLGQAFLVPYKSKAQALIGYKGFIAMADRAGLVLNAEVVYEGDFFEYALGTDPFIKHRPTDDAKARGEITHAYSVVRYPDGRTSFKLINRLEVERAIQSSSSPKALDGQQKVAAPWYWRKTAVRRHAPFLPLSTEFARAVVLDEQAEQGDDQQFRIPDVLDIEVEPESKAATLSERAAHEIPAPAETVPAGTEPI